MSSGIDIFRLLDKIRTSWDHIESATQAIDEVITKLREAGKHGYLGELYRTDYIVTGRGAFPIDMLRYTQSWPKEEASARAIEDSIEHGSADDVFEVLLTKYHRDPVPVLSEDRWKSKFRWQVLRIVDTVPQ